MVKVAKEHQDHLETIKKNVANSYDYFSENYQAYHRYMKFLFVTSLTEEDIQILQELKKPILEFCILESFVSRLRGEFSKCAPEMTVGSEFGQQIDSATIETVEGHFRALESNFRGEGEASQVYTDQLGGSFSVMKVWTDYSNAQSFDQNIIWGRVFDPTLCGFDPMARKCHKGDGQYCYEIYPLRVEEFKDLYPDIDISSIKFRRNIKSFSWSYRNMNEDIIILCDYYEKKKKTITIVKLSNGQVMTKDDYEKFEKQWNESGNIEQVPTIVKSRKSYTEEIHRYKLIENQILEHKLTNFKYLPLVFVDGNSVTYRESMQSASKQKTRPYFYQAKDTQRLKNFAGQTLANELENMVQHKFMIAKESIPPGYEDAYTDVQTPNVIVYNSTHPDDPTQQLPPPINVNRQPIPAEVTNTFRLADELTQTILGSYDASLGINNNQLSGIAVVEAATQSNAAAMPAIVNYMKSLNQIAKIVLDLIPKYYVTPRSIPVIDKEGKRTYKLINIPGSPQLNYDENALNVKVEAGMSFAVQKSKALQQITSVMQASPLFAQFMNEEGLPILLDNMDIRGVDELKEKVEQFLENIQQQQAQQQQIQQQAAQENPVMMKLNQDQQRLQLDEMQNAAKNKIELARVAVDKQNADTNRLKALSQLKSDHEDNLIQQEKTQTEQAGQAVDLALKEMDLRHKHSQDFSEESFE